MAALLGHGAIWSRFTDDYSTKHLHHAWLITGPKGLGKATLARQLAAFLQIAAGKSDEPSLLGETQDLLDLQTQACNNESPIRHQIESNSHADVRIIKRAEDPKTGRVKKDIAVSQIRDLIGYFSQTSATEGWRVAIIDAADDMSVSAANALLKILEEPPQRSILFLVSHSPGRLLPTIKSRCLKLSVKSLNDDKFTQFMSTNFTELDYETRNIVAGLSDGVPGRAIEIIREEGANLYVSFNAVLKSLPHMDFSLIHRLCSDVTGAKNEMRFHQFLSIIRNFLETMVKTSAGVLPVSDFETGDRELKISIAEKASLERWTELWEKTLKRFDRMEAVNLDPHQVLVGFFHDLNQLVMGK